MDGNGNFGNFVAIDGDHFVTENDVNTVQVFERIDGAWTATQSLDSYVRSLAMDGEYLVVGSLEEADVYHRTTAGWSHMVALTATDTTSGNIDVRACAIQGSTVLAGVSRAYVESGGDIVPAAGAVYVFARLDAGTPSDPSDDTWVQQQKLIAPQPIESGHFGQSVAIDGDHLVIGSELSPPGTMESGQADIFGWNGTSWVHEATLQPDIDATVEADRFGQGVTIYGDRVAVGAPYDSTFAPSAGAAYVFKNNGSAWVQEAKLFSSFPFEGDWFGWSTALYGERLLVGSLWDDDVIPQTGSVYVFHHDASVWIETAKFTGSTDFGYWRFSQALAFDGMRAAVGAWGGAHVFEVIGAPDANGDGVTDACQADCNENGILDNLEIAQPGTADCTGNYVPDECEVDLDLDGLADICEPTIFELVPVDPPAGLPPYPPGTIITNNEITLPPGSHRVWLEIRLGGWGPYFLQTWQATILAAGYSSGSGDPLTPATQFCASDLDCSGLGRCEEKTCADGAPCYTTLNCADGSLCDDRCRPVYQEADRPDDALNEAIRAVSTALPDYKFGGTAFPSIDTTADVGQTAYGGTLVLDVPAAAAGTYTVQIEESVDSFFSVIDGDLWGWGTDIHIDEFIPARIAIREPQLEFPCCLSEFECTMLSEATCTSLGGTTVDSVSSCSVDENGDGFSDACATQPIPAVSEWGLVVLALLLVAGAKIRATRNA